MRKTLAAATVAAVAGAGAVALPAESATRGVSVRDNVFSPRSLTVKRTDTVKFTWRGDNPHNLKITGPIRRNVSARTSGTYNFRPTKRGKYSIVCTIHAGMRMTLTSK